MTLPAAYEDRQPVKDLVERLMGRDPAQRFQFIQSRANQTRPHDKRSRCRVTVAPELDLCQDAEAESSSGEFSVASFSGDPKTIWLTEDQPDRRMKLIEDFRFSDRAGRIWDAPAGSVVDGASIPRPLWSLIGSPYTGDYRRASIVHDIACVAAGNDGAARKAADKMFYQACRAGGCGIRDSIILYIGVRIGAWLPHFIDEDMSVRVHPTSTDREIVADFQTLCDSVLSKGETDDPDEVEARTEDAMNRLAIAKLEYITKQQEYVAAFAERR